MIPSQLGIAFNDDFYLFYYSYESPADAQDWRNPADADFRISLSGVL